MAVEAGEGLQADEVEQHHARSAVVRAVVERRHVRLGLRKRTESSRTPRDSMPAMPLTWQGQEVDVGHCAESLMAAPYLQNSLPGATPAAASKEVVIAL